MQNYLQAPFSPKTTSYPRLNLDELKNEFKALDHSEMSGTKAGGGVVTSGTGTEEDPYVVTSVILYGDDLDSESVDALLASALSFGEKGAVNDGNGVFYRYNVDIQYSTNLELDAQMLSTNIDGNEYNYGVKFTTGGLGTNGTFGSTLNASSITFDQDKVNSVFTTGFYAAIGKTPIQDPSLGPVDYIPASTEKASWLEHIMTHEIGHSLGLEHNTGGVMKENITITPHLEETEESRRYTFSGDMEDMTGQDLIDAIQKMEDGKNGGYLRNPFIIPEE